MKLYRLGIIIVLLAAIWLSINYFYEDRMAESVAVKAMQGIYDPTEYTELQGHFVKYLIDGYMFAPLGFGKQIRIVDESGISQKIPLLVDSLVWGYFDDTGLFHAASIRIQYTEMWKLIVSGLGFIWFLFIFFKEWKITWMGFESA